MEQLAFWPDEQPAAEKMIARVRSRLLPGHGMHEAVWAEREAPMPLEVFLVRVADLAPSEHEAERALTGHAMWLYGRARDERRDVEATTLLVERAVAGALPICLEAAGERTAAEMLRLRVRSFDLGGAGDVIEAATRLRWERRIREPLYMAALSARWAVSWIGEARKEIACGIVSRGGERSPVEMAASRAAAVFAQASKVDPWGAFRGGCDALSAARREHMITWPT